MSYVCLLFGIRGMNHVKSRTASPYMIFHVKLFSQKKFAFHLLCCRQQRLNEKQGRSKFLELSKS